MNTENDIKEFGFRHISINTVYNVLINAPLGVKYFDNRHPAGVFPNL